MKVWTTDVKLYDEDGDKFHAVSYPSPKNMAAISSLLSDFQSELLL